MAKKSKKTDIVETDNFAEEIDEKAERKKQINKVDQQVDVAGTIVNVSIYTVERDGEVMHFGSHKEALAFVRGNRRPSITRRIKSTYERFCEVDVSKMNEAEQDAFQKVCDSLADYLEIAR